MMPSCPHLLWYKYLLLLCSVAGYLYSVFKERERSLIKWLDRRLVSHSNDTSLKVTLYSVVLRRSSRFDNGEYPLCFSLYFTILEHRNIHSNYQFLALGLGRLYTVYSPLGLSRFQNKEYSLCFVLY